jgi:hypothetical protein
MAKEKSELVEVKFIRPAIYKGVEFKLGLVTQLDPNIAERLIAEGTAVAAPKAKSEKADK